MKKNKKTLRYDNAKFVDHQPSMTRLPRGTSSLPKDVVDREQRRRLIQGIASAVAEKGYAAATVADITRIAGVSRATFYALFKDKEDCFLYGLRKLSDAQMTEVEAEYAKKSTPEKVLKGALDAYIRRINADMNLSQAFIAEAASATPSIRIEFENAIRRFEQGLRKWLKNIYQQNTHLKEVSNVRMALVMSALTAYITSIVRTGRPIENHQIHEIFSFIHASFGLPLNDTHTSSRVVINKQGSE